MYASNLMNKRTIAIIVALFLLAMPAFSVLAEDTLIQNGGFEAPADSGGIPEGWFKKHGMKTAIPI